MTSLEQAQPRTAAVPASSAPYALQEFILRMGDFGHCVSGTFMMFDRLYALEQLQHAHTLADERLRELAVALFRHFELQRSGIAFAN